jgi:hypothetical protein
MLTSWPFAPSMCCQPGQPALNVRNARRLSPLTSWQCDVLQAREAGTQCTRYPKAFNDDHLAMRAFDALQAQAAGTQCMQCST